MCLRSLTFSTYVLGFLLVLDVCANTEVMELCRTAMEIDCDVDYAAEGDETLCATDGHTYANLYVFHGSQVLFLLPPLRAG